MKTLIFNRYLTVPISYMLSAWDDPNTLRLELNFTDPAKTRMYMDSLIRAGYQMDDTSFEIYDDCLMNDWLRSFELVDKEVQELLNGKST